MCVSNDEEQGSGGSTAMYEDWGGLEVVTVTAPRLTIDQNMLSNVDWGEVTRVALIGSIGGVASFNWAAALIGAATGGLAQLESQPGVDLSAVMETTYDIPIIPGYPAPYISLH